MDISQLALAFGSSLAAGLNLYLTVLSLGLLNRFNVIHLPSDLQVLSNPWVLTAAGALFIIEFIADKIPYVDSTWDAVHTFIRTPAGAILAVGAMSGMPSHWTWIVALLGGFVSLSAHGAKASTRLAVNASPEPFSNWTLSFLEDGVSLGILWLMSHHPYLAIGVGLALMGLFLSVIYIFFRFLRLLFHPRQARVPA